MTRHTPQINISDRNRCIFIHIPKVAGTSIKQALGLPGQGHPPWKYFAERFPDQWQSYFRFTVVRNPWSRLVSAFCYAQMENSYWHNSDTLPHPDYALLKDKTFSEFCDILLRKRTLLEHESWYPQSAWVVGEHEGKEVLEVDQVLRFENLASDFAMLCDQLGIAPPMLPLVNLSPHKDYHDYYDKYTTDIVGQVYAADVATFGYEY